MKKMFENKITDILNLCGHEIGHALINSKLDSILDNFDGSQTLIDIVIPSRAKIVQSIISCSRYRDGWNPLAKLNEVSYFKIVDVLGDPNAPIEQFRSDATWRFNLKYSVEKEKQVRESEFVIYNWKNGPAFNDGVGDVEEIRDWRIGATNETSAKRAEELVRSVLRGDFL